jgi:hypothetical protein
VKAAISEIQSAQTEFEEIINKQVEGLCEELGMEIQGT